MRKRQRFAFLAIGGLGLLAAIAPGLAAGLNIDDSAGTPAAGQGRVTVQGFEVANILWDVSDEGKVTEVTFDIERDGDGGTSTVDDANATVRVSLNTDSGGDTVYSWTDCSVTTGEAVCTRTGTEIDANDLTEVEIIAFDSDSN